MVTNYPQSMTAHNGLRRSADHAHIGGFGKLKVQMRQLLCSITGGHDAFLKYEGERLSLQCVSCGHETSGWELNEAPPTITVRGDARRHEIARPQLVHTRRVA